VNNAGVYRLDSLESITAESIAEHFDLNVRGLLLTTQAAARVLPAGGVIVNVSSGAAKSPSAQAQVYSATKGAVDVLTRTLGMVLGPRDIRVVGIAPGFVLTEGNAGMSEGLAEHSSRRHRWVVPVVRATSRPPCRMPCPTMPAGSRAAPSMSRVGWCSRARSGARLTKISHIDS
jgi:NAD(P)-dependent dehydrogenase (short-subunit alcohol dehydrogenase family)